MTDAAARHEAARRALDGLRDRYRASSAQTIETLASIAAQLTAAPDDAEGLATLVDALHRVRGTAGSFGFADATRLAGDLEARAKAWSADPQRERADRADAVRAFAAALRDALA